MTCVVVTNSGTINITVNGVVLEPSTCRGVQAPVTIEGNGGEFFLSHSEELVSTGRMISREELDENQEPVIRQVEERVRKYETEKRATLTDSRGEITQVVENTRYPQEGSFPLLKQWVIE